MYRAAAVVLLIILTFGLNTHSSVAGELSKADVRLRPELNLPDLSRKQRSLDEFAGKVVLVNFWASWCTPCLEEMPAIRRLAAAMRDKPFVVIGVNVGEVQRRVQLTVQRLEIDFTARLDKHSSVFKNWGATVLPTTYVLGRNGRVRYIGQGPLEWDRVDIIELLGELTEEHSRLQ